MDNDDLYQYGIEDAQTAPKQAPRAPVPVTVSEALGAYETQFAEIQDSRVVRSAGDPAAFAEVMSFLENPIQGTPCQLFEFNRLCFLPGDVTIWAGVNGHGKALSLDTEIPTPDGWKKMADIHPGDKVFDENGMPCKVIAETEVQLNRPCYFVRFNDGTEIVADAKHEWLTDDYKSRLSRGRAKKNNRINQREVKKFGSDQTYKRKFAAIRTTEEISATLFFNNKSQKNKTNHSINVCKPLQYPEQRLPIPPYTLGAWLGDGTSLNAEITAPDHFVIERIESDGYEISKHKNEMAFGILGLQKQLRENNLLNNKHVPDVYLKASLDQRLALLQGLMDTDGHCSQHTCEFCSTNKKLATAVYELVISIGCIAHFITGRARLYGKDCGEKYRVTFTTEKAVFSLPRKKERLPLDVACRAKQRFIVSCDPCQSVPVKCIEVNSSSHLYLASRSCVPTHNSLLTGQVLQQLMMGGERCFLMSLEMKPKYTFMRMMRQAMGRKMTAHDSELINDWFQWAATRLVYLDKMGHVTPQEALALSAYAAKVYGCKHIFLDNLMRIVPGETDYDGQKDFMQAVCEVAINYDVHIHIVHHCKKSEKETDPIGKFSLRGSTALSDQASNIITIQRNLEKERKRQENNLTDDEDHQMGDVLIRLEKNRNGDWQGSQQLWFCPESTAYSTNFNRGVPALWGGLTENVNEPEF